MRWALATQDLCFPPNPYIQAFMGAGKVRNENRDCHPRPTHYNARMSTAARGTAAVAAAVAADRCFVVAAIAAAEIRSCPCRRFHVWERDGAAYVPLLTAVEWSSPSRSPSSSPLALTLSRSRAL